MSALGSVTQWLHRLKKGDAQAAQALWERYYARLVLLAQAKLRNLPRGPADEEDVALSAFNGFCLAVQQGRFPRLNDRHDLWEVLALLTDRRARDLRRHSRRQKRGGDLVRAEASCMESAVCALNVTNVVINDCTSATFTLTAPDTQPISCWLQKAGKRAACSFQPTHGNWIATFPSPLLAGTYTFHVLPDVTPKYASARFSCP